MFKFDGTDDSKLKALSLIGVVVKRKNLNIVSTRLEQFANQKAKYYLNDLISKEDIVDRKKNSSILKNVLSIYTDMTCTSLTDFFLKENKSEILNILQEFSEVTINMEHVFQVVLTEAFIYLKRFRSEDRFHSISSLENYFSKNNFSSIQIQKLYYCLCSIDHTINQFWMLNSKKTDFNKCSKTLIRRNNVRSILDNGIVSKEELFSFFDDKVKNKQNIFSSYEYWIVISSDNEILDGFNKAADEYLSLYKEVIEKIYFENR